MKKHTEVYAVVGELVLMASGLDALLNSVMVQVLNLGASAMLEPVVATLDPGEKIEILKKRARFHPTGRMEKACDQLRDES